MTQCPICLSEAPGQGHQPTSDGHGAEKYECPRCGPYFLSVTLLAMLPQTLGEDEAKRSLLSHAVRKMQRQNQPPFLTSGLVKEILKGSLPSPFQQAENLVLWLGTNLKGPGETIGINPASHLSIVGSRTPEGFVFVLEHLFSTGILGGSLSKRTSMVTLSFDGWRHFDQLHRGAATSRKAFMAMKYGDATLDFVVDKALRPALRKTGFSLQRLDEAPKAGLIDDRLRVEIRTSRFLIADLTHENAGAYWEAGFAEGLGKPVVYTCEKGKFAASTTHFDTNHHLTVLWSTEDLPACEEELKATIRATLPDEAVLQDVDPGAIEV